MHFISLEFVGFLAVVFATYWANRRPGRPTRGRRRARAARAERRPVGGERDLLWLGSPVVLGAARLQRPPRLPGRARPQAEPPAAQPVAWPVARRQPRDARHVQVLRLLLGEPDLGAGQRGVRGPPVHAGPRAPGRHLVLHLPDAVLHDRRLPAEARAAAVLPRTTPSTSPSSPSWSRAPSSAPAACCPRSSAPAPSTSTA